ncbi:ATPase [Roseibium sp. RKSG952]|uniref:ATPase n=1 Tax=Roseibium sp. RKSG952 TaxID=2529384 RepID=UPI0012BD5C66|nr:ATPase [Roseibium sp. RKSG952]MTH94580.1 ATPase [Roseibium sp. RKSG952]
MKLTWKRTWRDRPNDGTGTHSDYPDRYARTYQEPGGTRWFWFVNDSHSIDRGISENKDAAKAACEKAFEIGLGITRDGD